MTVSYYLCFYHLCDVYFVLCYKHIPTLFFFAFLLYLTVNLILLAMLKFMNGRYYDVLIVSNSYMICLLLFAILMTMYLVCVCTSVCIRLTS